MNKKYYVDMDGVLAKWDVNASIEETFQRGYFLNREPDYDAIKCVKNLITAKCDVTILSHAYQNGYAESEKIQWLNKYGLGNLKRIFVPYGVPKLNYVMLNPDTTINYLIDDFTKNLREWESTENNIGIKYYNGINGTHGTWKGMSINSDKKPNRLQTIIKDQISIEDFKNIKAWKAEDYEEGYGVSSVWTFESTKVPMILDIRQSNLEEDEPYLESWNFYLKEDGNIYEEEDYNHFDGECIATYDQLQSMNYDDFINLLEKNIYEYNDAYQRYLETCKLKDESDRSDDIEEIEI